MHGLGGGGGGGVRGEGSKLVDGGGRRAAQTVDGEEGGRDEPSTVQWRSSTIIYIYI